MRNIAASKTRGKVIWSDCSISLQTLKELLAIFVQLRVFLRPGIRSSRTPGNARSMDRITSSLTYWRWC
eukprot:g23221.t1